MRPAFWISSFKSYEHLASSSSSSPSSSYPYLFLDAMKHQHSVDFNEFFSISELEYYSLHLYLMRQLIFVELNFGCIQELSLLL